MVEMKEFNKCHRNVTEKRGFICANCPSKWPGSNSTSGSTAGQWPNKMMTFIYIDSRVPTIFIIWPWADISVTTDRQAIHNMKIFFLYSIKTSLFFFFTG